MNTILISGTAKITSTNYVEYDLIIWAAKDKEDIQYIRSIDKILTGYSELWKVAKDSVVLLFRSIKF